MLPMSLEPTLELPITQYIRLIVHLDKIWYATIMKNIPLRDRLNYFKAVYQYIPFIIGYWQIRKWISINAHFAIYFLCLHV